MRREFASLALCAAHIFGLFADGGQLFTPRGACDRWKLPENGLYEISILGPRVLPR